MAIRTQSTTSKWLVWLSALISLAAVILNPVSNRITRVAALFLLFVVWLGLIHLCWPRRCFRYSLFAVTLLVAGFLLLPARQIPAAAELRTEYVEALRRYDGKRYVWGGEGFRGVDCSGLIRCGLMDSLSYRGLRTLDPGLVRYALSLWWNDSSAKALGEMHRGLTTRLFDARSVNELDHSKVLPGDLAVTRDGSHIMAYLGDQRWIEADPMEMRVVSLTAPNSNLWFATPMKIVRWNVLSR
jgi:cell wall-associated NlpC family hydrolase